jgi:nitrate/TMAO reductase-like tetraheme cytochrome c subunit
VPQAQITHGVPPHQPLTAVTFVNHIGIALSIIALFVVLYTAFVHRNRLLEPKLMWLHLIGLAILPLFIWFLGNFVAVEGAKKVVFCGSCHPVMDPYVNDMIDPSSKTLAASHFRNRYIVGEHCYSCHVTYGLFGTFEAKMAGMKDVYRFYTGTWELPITLSLPYSNWNCLYCHAGAPRFEELDLHVDFEDDMRSDDVSCLKCHSLAHPPQSTTRHKKEGA